MSDNGEATGKCLGKDKTVFMFSRFVCLFVFATMTSDLSLREHSILTRQSASKGSAHPSPNRHPAPNTEATCDCGGRPGHSHVLVDGLHGSGREAHVPEHLGVGVRVLQGLPLELDGGQRAIDLRELSLQPLLSPEGLQRS